MDRRMLNDYQVLIADSILFSIYPNLPNEKFPSFSLDPIFGKTDMGSLVHSRECDNATAFAVISSPLD